MKTRNMKKCCFIALLLVLFTVSPLSAADDLWYSNMKISHVATYNTCYIIHTDSQDAVGCGIPGRFAIMRNNVMAKEIYATALTAFLANKFVDIYVQDTSNPECCYSGIVGLMIQIHN